MIQILTVLNPINNQEENWNIDIFNLDYLQWEQHLTEIIGNNDEMAFNYYINCLNPQIYKNKLYYDTKSFAYKDIITKYFRRLYTITNYIIYNYWLDKLLERIKENLIFENEFYNSQKMKDNPHKTTNRNKGTKKSTPKNIWIKHETEDLFEGNTIYLYENLKTGEQIESTNPDMLEELNTKKPKQKKQRLVITTFNFNKK